MSLAPLMDALLRIEHKLDAIIAANGIAVPPMRPGYKCPACFEKIRFIPDFSSQTIVRSCACGHSLQAPLQGLMLTPTGDVNDRTNHVPGRGSESGDPGDAAE